jgi:hypothetical protein
MCGQACISNMFQGVPQPVEPLCGPYQGSQIIVCQRGTHHVVCC